MRIRGWTVILSVLAAGAALSGCSAAARAPAVPGLGQQVLPVFAYLQSGAEATTYDQAYNILVAQCMARYGYSDPHQVYLEPPTPPMYRRYGVTSLAIASQWGYHLEAGSPLLAKGPPATRPWSSAELMVYTGSPHGQSSPAAQPQPRPSYRGQPVPAGGCAGQAGRQLGNTGAAALPNLPNQINEGDFTESMNQPDVLAVFGAWSHCMAQRGFDYRDPLQALSAATITTPSPGQRETDTAVADVQCKTRTHLVSIWFAAEYRLEEKSIQRNIVALTAIRAKLLAEEKAALAVIASAPAPG